MDSIDSLAWLFLHVEDMITAYELRHPGRKASFEFAHAHFYYRISEELLLIGTAMGTAPMNARPDDPSAVLYAPASTWHVSLLTSMTVKPKSGVAMDMG